MSDPVVVGGFLACLLFCPTPGLPLGDLDPNPTLRGTAFDCRVVAAERPGAPVWRGLFAGQSTFGDRTRGVSLEGCFSTRGQCEVFLDRMDGLMFGRVIQRRCTPGTAT